MRFFILIFFFITFGSRIECCITDSQCQFCKLYLKNVVPRGKFSEPAIQSISAPATQLIGGQLVLVLTTKNLWECGIYIESGALSPKTVLHNCNSHQVIFTYLSSIRKLNLILQNEWQPHQPLMLMLTPLTPYMNLFARSSKELFFQSIIVPINARVVAIGDLHGSSKSLRTILRSLYLKHIINHDGILNQDDYCILTGDYTDRGHKGAEVWNLIMNLKLKNPLNFFAARGNHEDFTMADQYSFFQEWKNTYAQNKNPDEQQESLEKLFNTLPSGFCVGAKQSASTMYPQGKYTFLLFAHGGIDPLVPLDKIIRKAIVSHKTNHTNLTTYTFDHPFRDFPGITWNDFVANETENQNPITIESGRAPLAVKANASAAYEYIEKHYSDAPDSAYTLEAIFRGHQHIPGGITKLRTIAIHSNYLSGSDNFEALRSNITQIIQRPSVYTCTSSPEGLGSCGCFEDSFAILEPSNRYWRVTPIIDKRTPKRFIAH